MKLKELKQKSIKELQDLLIEDRQKLGQFKFDASFKKLKNPKEIKEIKREVARILTLLKSYEKGNK